jgi:hypothetical protein
VGRIAQKLSQHTAMTGKSGVQFLGTKAQPDQARDLLAAMATVGAVLVLDGNFPL